MHPQVKALLDDLIASGRPSSRTLPLPDGRRNFDELFASLSDTDASIRTRDLSVPGPGGDIPLRLYEPPGEPPFPVALFFHGGGWVFGGAGRVRRHVPPAGGGERRRRRVRRVPPRPRAPLPRGRGRRRGRARLGARPARTPAWTRTASPSPATARAGRSRWRRRSARRDRGDPLPRALRARLPGARPVDVQRLVPRVRRRRLPLPRRDGVVLGAVPRPGRRRGRPAGRPGATPATWPAFRPPR